MFSPHNIMCINIVSFQQPLHFFCSNELNFVLISSNFTIILFIHKLIVPKFFREDDKHYFIPVAINDWNALPFNFTTICRFSVFGHSVNLIYI